MTDTASPPTAQAPSTTKTPGWNSSPHPETRPLGRPTRLVRIGFATISATTAVFTGFGAGYFTAGGPFVWTLLARRRGVRDLDADRADLTAKIPLAGYSYQWTSRLVGSTMALFTGVLALAGWICGMTGVGFILSGYLSSLFGWNMSQTAQILVAIGVMAVCMLINLYGVRFATMVQHRREPRVRHHRRRNDSRRDRRLLLTGQPSIRLGAFQRRV